MKYFYVGFMLSGSYTDQLVIMDCTSIKVSFLQMEGN
jgi:hypothetical protein